MALRPKRNTVTSAEERKVRAEVEAEAIEFRDAELAAADGISLQAWYLQPTAYNGNAVVLLHGVADNRLGMMGYGRMLLAHHYAVLLPDARAHGNSGGILATYGVKETGDIRSWVDWLEATQYPNCVFGLGESMGAAQLLQSVAADPRFCGVVAESAFSTFREVAYDRIGRPFQSGPWLGRTFLRPLVDVSFLYAHLRYGVDLERASSLAAVAKSQVPVFLIHGLNDENVPARHSETLAAANPSDVTLWEVPGAPHAGAYGTRPREFERRLIEFLEEHSTTARPSVPRLRISSRKRDTTLRSG